MALEGWALKALKEDLNEQLQESRIDRIIQSEKGDYTFHFRKRGQNLKVLISLHPDLARIHITEGRYKNPPSPLGFTQLMRNRLQGAKFVAVEQMGAERVLEFQLVNLDELGELKRFYLMVELMGKHSNLILLNQNRIIVDSHKHVHSWQNRYREILPNYEYKGPPPQGKQDFTDFNFDIKEKETEQSLLRWLRQNIDGIGQSSGFSLLQALNFPADLPLMALGQEEKEKLKDLVRTALQNRRTGMLFVQGEEIIPFEFEPNSGEWINASLAVDNRYSRLEELKQVERKRTSLKSIVNNALEKARRKLFALQEDLNASIDSEHLRIWGELLKNSEVPEKRSEEVAVTNFYDPELKQISIPLDIRYNLQQNAQIYFKRYSKAKKGERLIAEQLQLTQEEVDYLESVLTFLDNGEDLLFFQEIEEELLKQSLIKKPTSIKQTKGKQKKTKDIKSTEAKPLQMVIENVRVSVGRNNSQNDYLTMEMAQPNDWWFHVKNSAGSHVIVHKKDISESLFEKAAAIAAYFSKERDNSYVSVDYTLRRNVKKFKGAKPGAVHYTNFQTLYVSPENPDDLID